MTAQPILPIALNMTGAVAYSGLSRSRLYELMREGDLPSFQVGGRRMIRRDALDAFFAKLAEAA
ncbi:helix-turn-helix domain-containing protein [Caulobacter sp. 3R27C2-B]|uniref:helix-turn-helix domain-containing protein n=1 Tax=Caulobacter sp. 3R27C2-B TaxID=2502219 RepID=UPI001BB19107|nr:helix-turn-helix domain-containing protein [Caulobacter sp. 3R27C2-B]